MPEIETSPWAEITPGRPIEDLPNAQKLELAKSALAGGCFPDGNIVFGSQFHDWLRWIQSDDPTALTWWNWINEREPGLQRDPHISLLWQSINDPNGVNRAAKEQVMKEITAWSFYERHFFNWFLSRYNAVDARRVFNNNWLTCNVHLPVGLLTIGIVVLFFGWSGLTLCEWLCAALLIALVFVSGNLAARLQPAYYLQSLIPRMAVTTALGYLFLFSASGLVATIYYSQFSLIWHILISLALVVFVIVYMIQVIQRRVVPRLNLWQACRRSLHLLCLGLAYSAIGLLVSAPVLFTPTFLEGKPGNHMPPASPEALITTAVIVLAIGVALQLVWEDKPVTEPF